MADWYGALTAARAEHFALDEGRKDGSGGALRSLGYSRAVDELNAAIPVRIKRRAEAKEASPATMKRRTMMCGLIAGIVAALNAPAAMAATTSRQPPLNAEPLTHPHGLRGDINGQLTVLQLRGHGGFGDGSSHPVSTVIGSLIPGYSEMSGAAQLAAIQASPFVAGAYALATTDEMDLLAFRACAAQAVTQGGSTIFAEAGIWRFSGILPACPAATDVNQTRQATWNLVGEGSMSTILYFPTDVSTGYSSVFALGVANRTNADGTNYAGTWQGFTMVGPGTTITYGSKNCQLSGIGWGARRQMSDIHVVGFYQGICIQGDQTLFRSILISQCTFGMMWDLVNGTLFGDFALERVQIVQCSIACVAASAVSQIPKTKWIKPIFATSPIGVAKLVNTEATGWQPNLLFEASMDGAQFEQMGYCPIAEIDATSLLPNPTAGSYSANLLVASQLLRTEFGPFDTSRKYPAYNPSAGIMEGQNCLGPNLISLSIESNLGPGSNGLLNCQYFGGWNGSDKTVIEGDWDSVFSNLRAVTNTSSYPRSTIANTQCDTSHLIIKAQEWQGRVLFDNSYTNPAIGTFVDFNDITPSFQTTTGTTTDIPSGGGVIMHHPTDGSSSSNRMAVATQGVVNILTGSTTWTGNQILRTAATSGSVTVASGPFDTTSLIIGMSEGAPVTGSSQYGGAKIVTVRLIPRFNYIDD